MKCTCKNAACRHPKGECKNQGNIKTMTTSGSVFYMCNSCINKYLERKNVRTPYLLIQKTKKQPGINEGPAARLEDFINDLEKLVGKSQLNIAAWEWSVGEYSNNKIDALSRKYKISRRALKSHLLEEQ